MRAEIVRTVKSKLAALDSIVRAVREHALKRRDPMLRLDQAFLTAFDRAEPIAHPVLEQLRLFTLAEAAEEAVAIRQLHALPTADRARRFEAISGLNKVAILENGHAVFEFDEACREAKFRPGDFALVLTNDDGHSLAETDAKRWLRRKLMVELIDYDLAASPPRRDAGVGLEVGEAGEGPRRRPGPRLRAGPRGGGLQHAARGGVAPRAGGAIPARRRSSWACWRDGCRRGGWRRWTRSGARRTCWSPPPRTWDAPC